MSSFFAELMRRNVIRVGVAYAIVAWLLAQAAEMATDIFEAPPWVAKIFVVFLVLGFPLALFFAWAFELTPEGLKKEKDVDRTRSITAKTGHKLDEAFNWLEKAYNDGELWLEWLRSDPFWDLLRDDPRFDKLVRRMNFPPAPQ